MTVGLFFIYSNTLEKNVKEQTMWPEKASIKISQKGSIKYGRREQSSRNRIN